MIEVRREGSGETIICTVLLEPTLLTHNVGSKVNAQAKF